MSQMQLFSDTNLEAINPVFHDPDSDLEVRFQDFHEANPHVYQELIKRALALRSKGIRRFGIAAIFESLRYDAALQTGGDPYKLNNSYRAFYARLIMDKVVALDGFFETREQKAIKDSEGREGLPTFS